MPASRSRDIFRKCGAALLGDGSRKQTRLQGAVNIVAACSPTPPYAACPSYQQAEGLAGLAQEMRPAGLGLLLLVLQPHGSACWQLTLPRSLAQQAPAQERGPLQACPAHCALLLMSQQSLAAAMDLSSPHMQQLRVPALQSAQVMTCTAGWH